MSTLALSDFDYELPPALIAQQPMLERSKARLLVLHRGTGKIEHRKFSDLPEYLEPGDPLVLNDTKVLKARLFGRKPTGGKVEILLHKKLGDDAWEVLIKPGGRVREGSEVFLGENGNSLRAKVLDAPRQDSGLRRIQFWCDGDLEKTLDAIGRVPLPPYIDRPDTDIDRELYQTVFAKKEGAVASPTAGLHFDPPLLEKIKARGIETVFITLHVGYGTFQPVAEEKIEFHAMHPEAYEVSQEAVLKLNRALGEKKKITACGTTVVRTLETLVSSGQRGITAEDAPGSARGSEAVPVRGYRPRAGGGEAQRSSPLTKIRPGCGETALFIYPPYPFKAVDRMITNFHLPKTTLLMLASAFAGHELLMKAYREAVRENYRFYSYGDAMLIL